MNENLKSLATVILNDNLPRAAHAMPPRPTPLNANPLLWHLFDRAKIPMPAAEAYEYAKIEAEEAMEREIEAEFAALMNAELAKHERKLEREQKAKIKRLMLLAIAAQNEGITE